MKQTSSKTKINTRQIGDLGEALACEYLTGIGLEVLERNYWKKWGELDIVARKNEMVHFVEVKTVSYETKADLEQAVLHETWRPEELVHKRKLRQIEQALETWKANKRYEGEWQIDVIGVRIVPRETYCTVNLLENVILR